MFGPNVKAKFFTPSAPGYVVQYVISGVTKDSSGAALGNCIVSLFQTGVDSLLQRATSDPTTGAYSFSMFDAPGRTFYVEAYKAGAPDVAGATVNTLVAT
jgi:hypothetical protein